MLRTSYGSTMAGICVTKISRFRGSTAVSSFYDNISHVGTRIAQFENYVSGTGNRVRKA